MKKYGSIIALSLAILFGTVAVMLANNWLNNQAAEERIVVKEAVPVTRIVIAASDLDIGTKLSGANLTLAEWPKANVPKGAYESLEGLDGRITATKIVAGDVVIAAKLAAPGSGAGLVAMIEPGKRAMSIRVDEVIGVGGFVLPNTFVDVISITKDGRDSKRAETVLKNIQVLAIAQETFTEEGKAKVVRTVTLSVTPKEAEKLALETHEGAIQLILRNPNELAEPEPPPVVAKPAPKVVRTLKPRVVQPKAPSFQVEVIQGDRAPEKYNFTATN
ncbi:MAG: Flp pilus assembly protein CpaB [Desulfuromonadales bacterium]|nr:Flp pilus assembly protein CpaB [Desulfuromonadales bacterium]MDW7758143.1 Flp pilus assembly protein CpaB [Desulfuromonadales bacterium]